MEHCLGGVTSECSCGIATMLSRKRKRGKKMNQKFLEFVETPMFTKKMLDMGITDDELLIFQNRLMQNPRLGDEIQGVPGLRKFRISYNGHGKRGGARVLYVFVEIKSKIHLIDIYPKNEKEDITSDEKKALAILVKILKEE
jgi:hypothetical protein